MSARTQVPDTDAADLSAGIPMPLQRSCACGTAAGASGQCSACATAARLGVQPKLTVGTPGDRYEREADRIAERVLSNDAPNAQSPMPFTPLVRPTSLARQESDTQVEEEETLQPKAASPVRSPRLPPRFTERLSAETRGGRPLDRAARSFFEPRFGHDLSGIRLHASTEAANLSHDIGARAFTHKNHILFGAGAHDTVSRQGRRLLAHEIAHTLQQRSAPNAILQRAPEDEEKEPKAESYPLDQIHVFTKATIREASIPLEERVDAVHDGPVGPYFPGDTILVSVWRDMIRDGKKEGLNSIVEPIEWTLPAGDLELAESLKNSDFRLRVTADPATLGGSRVVEAKIESDAFDEAVTFGLNLEQPPGGKVAIDPEGLAKEDTLETRKQERSDLRSQAGDARRERRGARKALRQKQRDDRVALRERQEEEGAYTRKERQADRAERQALRGKQKEKRHSLRDEQKDERGEFKTKKAALRGQIKDLRGDLREIDKESECTLEQQHLVETALETAMARAAAALSRISPDAEPDELTRASLKDFFRLDATPENRDAVRATLQRTIDVISLAANSMKVADHMQFVCAGSPIACNENSGAFVTNLKRGGTVTVCNKWLTGKASFEVSGSGDDGRAYALLHEFIHLSGITAKTNDDSELYVHSDEWDKLEPEVVAKMADAYAAFAWVMSRGGGTGGGSDGGSDEGGDGS